MGVQVFGTALLNAGAGFLSGGPAGAGIAAGLTVGGYLLEKTIIALNDEQEAELRKKVIKAPVVPANFVVGTTKISGALMHYSEKFFDKDTTITSVSTVKIGVDSRTQRRILALSELGIDSVQDIFIDSRKMPYKNDGNIIVPDLQAWQAEIEELTRRILLLGGDSAPQSFAGLLSDLMRRREELQDQLEYFQWGFTPKGQDNPSVPNVTIVLDAGEDAQSPADRLAKTYLEDEFPEWNGSKNNLQELSWILVRLRAYDAQANVKESDRQEIPAWENSEPNIQLVVKGQIDGEYTHNPAKIAQWLLKEIYGFTDDDLEGVDEAIAICDELIVLDPVTLATSSSILNPILKSLFPSAVDGNNDLDPSLLPNREIQTKALDEWNFRYAGRSNAETRFQCHGSITSQMMLSPQTLLNRLGFAMNGWIIPNGSKFKFVVGHNTPPVATINESEIFVDANNSSSGLIRTTFGPKNDKRFSAVKAELAQNREENFNRFAISAINDSELVINDGYREENLGVLPFQNNEIAARRLMTKYLRRIHPDLKRHNFTVDRGDDTWKNYRLSAGDRVTLNFPTEDVKNEIYRIVKLKANPNFTITMDVIEDPDSIYSDNFETGIEGLVSQRFLPVNRKKVVTTIGVVGITAEVKWDDITRGTMALVQIERKVIKIINIRAIGGILVFKSNDGDYIVGDENVGNWTLNSDGPGYDATIVLPQTDQRSNFITFAVRNGAGTAEDPYTYSGETLLPASSDIQVADISERIEEEPTEEDGKPIGTLYCQPA